MARGHEVTHYPWVLLGRQIGRLNPDSRHPLGIGQSCPGPASSLQIVRLIADAGGGGSDPSPRYSRTPDTPRTGRLVRVHRLTGFDMPALQSLIRTIPDHPKPGIQFRDITTLLRDPEGLRRSIDDISDRHRDQDIDLVVGIEARGFIFGTAIAYKLGVGFVPMRKPGKLPGETIGRDFDLEYGSDRIEMHVGAVTAGQRVLLVDDLIATGGTAEAAILLLKEVGAKVVESAFVVALPDLGGIERLEKVGSPVHWLCEFSGE